MPHQIQESATSLSPIMLRNNNMTDPRSFHPDSPFSSLIPPPSPQLRAPSQIDTDEMVDTTTAPTLPIAQLNCFNGKNITLNLLANSHYSILLLQEPWIDPHTLRLPSHPAWHDFTPYNYSAKTFQDRPRTGIYVTKRIPSWLITVLPSGSALLTALEVSLPVGRLRKVRVLSVYNPPTHNTGLPVLQNWLDSHNDRRTASIIGMDGNLHHTKWNPPNYRHTHTLAKELIKMCGSAGFQLTSQKNVPTFYPRASNARPTAIDLTWGNFELAKHSIQSLISSENYGSDHQLLLTTIQLDEPLQERYHNTARFNTMGKASFYTDLENQLSTFPDSVDSVDDIDLAIDFITDCIVGAFHRQGKVVKTSPHHHKAWWNEEKLGPIIKERTRARKWMILSRSQEAKLCYWS